MAETQKNQTMRPLQRHRPRARVPVANSILLQKPYRV